MKPQDRAMGASGHPRAKPRSQARHCPICGRRALAAHRPFCSRRCAEVDLGRWLGGRYFVAGERVAQADEPPE